MTLNILVAEDDKPTRTTIVDVIRWHLGDKVGNEISIDEVSDGEKLCEKLKIKYGERGSRSDSKYSIIFLDNDMPKVNGDELIKPIREYDKDVIICMISGSNKEELAKNQGANYYIHKSKIDVSEFEKIFKDHGFIK